MNQTKIHQINQTIVHVMNSFLSVFLEIKWYRTWLFYGVYVLAYMMFLLGLAGYALFHLGNIYDGGPKYDYKVSYVNRMFNYSCFAKRNMRQFEN